MREGIQSYINRNKTTIENKIKHYISRLEIPERLESSMAYSLNAGGKRLRPVLMVASFEAYNESYEKVLTSAAALEMIHTYSLIHDDLPAMDDDDYRRGKLTNHKQFDEATAILAGDALLTYSFEIISNDPLLSNSQKVHIINHLAKCSGPAGMVGGQIMDMKAEKQKVSIEELENIHALKTGELLRFAIHTGAYLGEASAEELVYLDEFAHYLGLVFQVQDDILDVIGDEKQLGKRIGSDEDNAKSTYPNLLGLEGAKKKKTLYVQRAKDALIQAKADQSYLMDLVDFFSNRDQ